ncbi:rho GTPase-activating protein 19 [Lampris incognitus]|uniref:rho GTPase-activating protein 19 n=1 Tax=Lampris incognitus TaxID=2546036 RepID=UPI0024B55261|nr:rho GTPase-activating protein 19 [Lampris incognitus]
MAERRDADENEQNRRGTVCNMVINHEDNPASSRVSRAPIIFDPDFFVEKLRHERPEVFLELVLSNVTRLIDLPGTEFAQLLGEESPKTTTSGNGGGFFRSLNFLKRKDKGVVFGTPLSEGSIVQIYQLIEYLSKNLHVEGLFRVPGNSVRQQALRELLNTGVDVDLESGDFHPNDVATLLKTFLGELPEPLLTHRHFHAHLKISDMTLFDGQGNKTAVPDKERQIETLQLLFLLLPQANRSLLKLLLDLLYHTAKQQDKNKMSASNLALMFAPHILWPRHMTAADLKDNLKKLNNTVAFLIKHSQKLFKAPAYIREHARMQFTGTKSLQTKDDMDLLVVSGSPVLRVTVPLKRPAGFGGTVLEPSSSQQQFHSPTQHHTEEALKELFRYVHQNMPDSAKKKKLIRQLAKQTTAGTPTDEYRQTPPGPSRKHPRSRSFGGLIKRKARGEQLTDRRARHVSPDAITGSTRKPGKENVMLQAVNSPLNGHFLGKAGLVIKSSDVALSKTRAMKVSKDSPSVSRMCFSPGQEVSV